MHAVLHSFAFNNLNESAITKGLRRCNDAPCIVMYCDGRPTFAYFLGGNVAFMARYQKKSGVFGFYNVNLRPGGGGGHFDHTNCF